jgi:hypothetical protein
MLSHASVRVAALSAALCLSVALCAQTAAAPAQTGATNGQDSEQQRVNNLAYQAGYASGRYDVQHKLAYGVQNQPLYTEANQGYQPGSGLSLTQYQANYRHGFQAGYNDGYYGRAPQPTAAAASPATNAAAPATPPPAAGAPQGAAGTVPAGTVLHLQLQNALSTQSSQPNQPFSATVTQPVRDAAGNLVIPVNSEVLGRVGAVHAATGLTGESTLQMQFQQIRLPNGRTAALEATVAQVGQQGSGVGQAVGGAVEGKPSTTSEGQVQQSRTRSTVGNVAAGGAVGALLGAIFGGGKGAAIGTAAGAGLGVLLASKRGPLNLPAGTPVTIRLSQPVYLQ